MFTPYYTASFLVDESRAEHHQAECDEQEKHSPSVFCEPHLCLRKQLAELRLVPETCPVVPGTESTKHPTPNMNLGARGLKQAEAWHNVLHICFDRLREFVA